MGNFDLLHNQAGFTGPELYKSKYSAKSMLEANCTVRYVKASDLYLVREGGAHLEELVAARLQH